MRIKRFYLLFFGFLAALYAGFCLCIAIAYPDIVNVGIVIVWVFVAIFLYKWAK